MSIFKLLLLLVVYQITVIHGKGKINLQLQEYHNPTGTDVNENCCDGIKIDGCPLGKCDHLFKICVFSSNSTNCIQSTDVTGPSDHNDIIFDSNQQPVQFYFDTWKGEVHIRIDIYDSNTEDKNVLVDQFVLVYNSSVGFNETSSLPKIYVLSGSRQKNPTSLKLSMSAFCDAQYYGDDCSVKCVPTNQCGGHFTCDRKGKIICLPGWRGSECTEQIPGSDVDCSVYTDKTEFVPSEWEGLYTCPGDNVQHFLFNVTKTNDHIALVADLSIGTHRTEISGTYSSFIHALALQVESTFISWGKYNLTKLALETQERNSSSMIGQLTLYTADKTKLMCSVNTLNLKKAYFDGCNFMGTCVRYGKRKEEYYCCCNDVIMGQSCSKISTNTTLTTPSTILRSTTTAAPTTGTPQPTTTDHGSNFIL